MTSLALAPQQALSLFIYRCGEREGLFNRFKGLIFALGAGQKLTKR